MKTTTRRLLCLLTPAMLLGSVVLVLPACSTVKGVGEDISNVGQAGERAISDNESKADQPPAHENK